MRIDRLMGIDLRDLELFVEVADVGSITHGAGRVHLALPSASTRIRLMERNVGATLLERTRRGVTPTAAGRLLLRHARAVLGQLDELRGELAQYSDGLSATVRLLVNTATASALPGGLIPFLRAHPEIDVDLAERSSHRIVQAIAERRADLGIVANTVSLGRLDTVRLRADRLVLATAADHPLAARQDITFAACLAEPFVGLNEGNPLQEHLEGHAQPLGRLPGYRVRLPSAAAVCQAVAAGIGVAVLPEAVLPTAVLPTAVPDTVLSTAGLAAVPLSDPWANRELVLCTNPDVHRSAAVQALIEYLLHP